MKMKLSILVAVLLMMAATAQAGERPGIDRAGCGVSQSASKDEITLWSQTMTCVGAFCSSEDIGESGAHTESIDDFTASSYYAITSLEWWGIRVYDPEMPYFRLRIYGDDGNCGPDESNVVTDQFLESYVESTTECSYYYHYESDVDPIAMEPGTRYWICIQAALVVDTEDDYSEWYWAIGDEVVDCPAMYRCEYWGVDSFTPLHDLEPEYPGADAMAFVLYSDGLVANEALTWSEVKSLWR